MVREMLVNGLSLEEVAEKHGYTAGAPLQRSLREAIREKVPSAAMRAALFNCPVAETRRVMWQHISGEDLGLDLSGEWARHIVETYTRDSVVWAEAWAADSHQAARKALRWVEQNVDEDGTADWAGMMDAVTTEDMPEQTRKHLDEELTRGKGAPREGRAAIFAPVLERVERRAGELATENLGWTRWADRRVRVKSCEHCGGDIDHVLRVPEVPGGVMCSSCRKAPGLDVEFPADYLRMWAGFRGFGSTRQAQHNGTYEDMEATFQRA
jgi:hypothetical protein